MLRYLKLRLAIPQYMAGSILLAICMANAFMGGQKLPPVSPRLISSSSLWTSWVGTKKSFFSSTHTMQKQYKMTAKAIGARRCANEELCVGLLARHSAHCLMGPTKYIFATPRFWQLCVSFRLFVFRPILDPYAWFWESKTTMWELSFSIAYFVSLFEFNLETI